MGASGLEPDLAVSWSVSGDGTEWTFNLRRDARFPDGSIVNAADAIASVQAWQQRTGELTEITQLSQSDDFTLSVHLMESLWDLGAKLAEVEIANLSQTPAPTATPTPTPTAGIRLVRMGASGLEPDLAMSWSVSGDGTEWTFNLRRDARFPDGSAVNAADAIASIQAWQQRTGELTEITQLSQSDDFTLSVHLMDSPGDFLAKLAEVEIANLAQTPAPTATPTPAPTATPTPTPTAGIRLVRMGASGLEPDLAVSWSTSDDGTEWTFDLRRDARFPDGSIVNAADAIASIQAWQQRTGELTEITQLSQSDDFTLSVHLVGPLDSPGDFLAKLAKIEIENLAQ